MARHRVRRLPVVEDGMLVGVLSEADIALEKTRRRRRPARSVKSLPADLPHPRSP